MCIQNVGFCRADQKCNGDGEDFPSEWEWEDLLEELDSNGDGQLSAQV